MSDILLKDRLSRVTIYLSVGVFVLALTQKCYCTTASCGDSIMALLSGTIGFFFGGAALTWLANPLLIISWILSEKNKRVSLLFSGIAVLISVSFLLFNKVISDEAGNYSEIISYKLGYWLWVLSSSVMFIGNLIYRFIGE